MTFDIGSTTDFSDRSSLTSRWLRSGSFQKSLWFCRSSISARRTALRPYSKTLRQQGKPAAKLFRAVSDVVEGCHGGNMISARTRCSNPGRAEDTGEGDHGRPEGSRVARDRRSRGEQPLQDQPRAAGSFDHALRSSGVQQAKVRADRHSVPMRIDAPLPTGRLLRRYKRFLADVELEVGADGVGAPGDVIVAHCPNTGSLLGCLPERARCVLRDSRDPARKLRTTLQTIEVDGTWVNVDTGLPNAVVSEAVAAGTVPELAGYRSLRREVRYGVNSRIDLLLEDPGRCYVEVKSTTLVVAGEARFPDAVTERGKKHLEELAAMVAEGHRAVIFFHVSRADARCFAPADDIDPAYGAALRAAHTRGVELQAWTTRVTPDEVTLLQRLPCVL
jgi:sugar fermentation stimulation protein A